MIDILVTRSTEEQRLALEGDHPLNPFWLWPSWIFVEVLHLAYMMDLYVLGASTQFAVICEEPLY